MRKESIKNIALALLIVSSVVLTLNIWSEKKLWSEGYNFFSDIKQKIINVTGKNTTASGSLSKEKLALPKTLIINNPPKRGVYYTSSPEYDKMITDIKDGLISALESEQIEESSKEEWNGAISSKSVYVSYPVVYDTDIIKDIMGTGKSDLGVKTVKNFVIAKAASANDFFVYIKGGNTEEYKKCKIDFDKKTFDLITEKYAVNSSGLLPFSFELNFDKRAADASHQKLIIDPYVSLSITNTYHKTIEAQNPIYDENTQTYSSEKIDAILKKFLFNSITAKKYTQSDGSVVYVENYGTIKIFPTGLVEYKAIAADKGVELSSSENMNFKKTFTSALNFTTDLWNSVMPESDMILGVSSDIINSGSKVFRLEMNSYYDGVIIRDDIEKTQLHDEMNNALELVIKNGRIISYRQIFKTYSEDKNVIENISTISALDVLFGDDKFNSNDTVKDIYPAYTFDSNVCKMSWVIKNQNNKTSLLKN